MNPNNNDPIVLGELKKEKSSKPLFVFLVFALVLGTCFGLPYIQDYLVNGEGPIVDFYNNLMGNNDDYFEENTTTTTTTAIDDGLTLLKSDTLLNIDKIYIENISINGNSISFKIMARNSTNLDLAFYYLEIYDNNKSLLGKIKLTGYASSASKVITENLSFNANSVNYYLKLINLEEENLSLLNVTSLTCSNNANTYTYTFSNNTPIVIPLI